MLAKLTLQGLETWAKSNNRSVFDNIRLPEGIDKDLLIDSIIAAAGEFGLVYTDPDYMNARVINFFDRNYDIFDKWAYALSLEYNPLYNYDRYEDLQEDTTDRRAGSTVNNRDLDRRVDNIGLDHNTTDNDTTVISDGNNGNTSTVEKAVVNNANYNPYDKTTDQGSSYVRETTDGTVESNGSNENHVTEDTTDNVTQTEDITTTRGSTHTNHIYGNIGVTQSTDMVKNFILTRKALNPYVCISDMFCSEFCIMVY